MVENIHLGLILETYCELFLCFLLQDDFRLQAAFARKTAQQVDEKVNQRT